MQVPTTGELADREAIREVVNAYAHGVDRLDAALMRSAYWPDATDDHGSFVGKAWEFVERAIASHQRWAWTMHATMNHQIELEPGRSRASGVVHNVTYLMPADRSTLHVFYGRYLDRYERRGDEWRIIHRTCVHEATEVRPVTATMALDAAAFRQGYRQPSAHPSPS